MGSARAARGVAFAWWAAALAGAAPFAQPAHGAEGDPARGRVIVASRQAGLCLLCHRAPIAEERLQGDLAPDLSGVGARLTRDELRARLVDPRRFNPETIMPSYTRTEGLANVAAAWRGRPLLEPQQIDDVVAWLATLREAPK